MVTASSDYVLDILKSKNLSITQCRLAILRLFTEKNTAIALGNIEKSIKTSFDRVTIYRTLKSFLEIGIIHKVPDDNGQLKYALCKDHCPDHVHMHEHLHFKCTQCDETTCLEAVEIPKIILPAGYKTLTTNILIQGTCKNCNH